MSTASRASPGAHENGGVEGVVGWFRLNHLSPMPEVANLADLNDRICRWEAADERRRVADRIRMIGEDFAGRRIDCDVPD